MTETERIADQLLRSWRGDAQGEAWHGPCLQALLRDLAAAQAASHPVAGAHSIWEIVLHLTVWHRVPQQRIETQESLQPPPDQDWPAVADFSERAWKSALLQLEAALEELRMTILSLPDDRLNERVSDKTDTLYVMLHGVVQHDLYHAGQIALLRKALPR